MRSDFEGFDRFFRTVLLMLSGPQASFASRIEIASLISSSEILRKLFSFFSFTLSGDILPSTLKNFENKLLNSSFFPDRQMCGQF